jgi:hypothetical protein
MLVIDKHLSLLGLFLRYEEIEQPQVSTLIWEHYKMLHNLLLEWVFVSRFHPWSDTVLA